MRPRTGAIAAESLALAAPIALIIAFCIALCWLHPAYIADEKSHYPAVQSILRGDWAAVRWLPMPPTYHALAAAAAHVVGSSVVALRGFNTALGLICIVVAWGIVRRTSPGDPAAIARIALNPLFLSLCPLVYTDILSILFVLIALWAHLRRRFFIAAVALAGAMVVRQSNVVWPLLLIFLPIGEQLDLVRPLSLRAAITCVRCELWRRDRLPYAAALAFGAALVSVRNPLTDQIPSGNTPGLNVALFYCWAMAGAILWAPIWLLGCLHSPWLARIGARAPLLVVTLLAALALAANFHSPHGWNTDPSSLRNWPLLAMERSRSLTIVVCVVLTIMLIEAARRVWLNDHRHRLLVVWCMGAVFLAPHWLADPRYYLIPTAMLDIYAPVSRTESTRLAVWYGVLSLATIAMMLARPGGLVHL